MPLLIPDEILQAAKMTEQEARVEIACRLYDADVLPMWPAAQLAGLSRGEFEEQLLKRGLPLYHVDEEYMRHELKYAGFELSPRDER